MIAEWSAQAASDANNTSRADNCGFIATHNFITVLFAVSLVEVCLPRRRLRPWFTAPSRDRHQGRLMKIPHPLKSQDNYVPLSTGKRLVISRSNDPSRDGPGTAMKRIRAISVAACGLRAESGVSSRCHIAAKCALRTGGTTDSTPKEATAIRAADPNKSRWHRTICGG